MYTYFRFRIKKKKKKKHVPKITDPIFIEKLNPPKMLQRTYHFTIRICIIYR